MLEDESAPPLFRSKPLDSVPTGQSQQAVDADPSPLSGGAPIQRPAPVWKTFVQNSEFQEANRAGIAAEHQQMRAARRTSTGQGDIFKGVNGKLIHKAPGAKPVEYDANDWTDDPIAGPEARKSLWDREIRTSRQEAEANNLELANPAFHARELAQKDREAIEAEGSMLQETDPRHAELKSKLIADDEYRTRKQELAQKAWNAKARAAQLESMDPESWWAERQSQPAPTPTEQRQATVQAAQDTQAQGQAADDQAAVRTQEINAKLQGGVTGEESKALLAERADIAANRAKIAEVTTGAAKQVEGVQAEAAAKVPEKDFFQFGDTVSGIWDAVKGLGSTAPAAFYQLMEGMERPDQYSDAAKAAFAEADAFNKEMQAKTAANQAAGTSSSVGESFREAGGSLGFSLGSMAAAIPASLAGAKVGAIAGGTIGAAAGAPAAGVGAAPGAVAGSAIGGTIGGVTAGMAASGTAAYRMAGASFLNEAFQQLEAESMRKNGRPMAEVEKQSAYDALLPIAKNTALWEAGPEAVGNAVTMGAGKIIFGLGKPLAAKFTQTLGKKVATKVAAGAGSLATELAGETATNVEQSADQKKAQAIAQGQDPNAIKADWSAGGIVESFKEVAPQTLALMGLMGGAGGAIKVASMATGIGDYSKDSKRAAEMLEGVNTGLAAIDPTATVATPDEMHNAAFIARPTDAPADIAEAIIIQRELSSVELEDSSMLEQAQVELEQARVSGDKGLVAAAEAKLEQVSSSPPRAPLVTATLKIAAGKELNDLTSEELAAVGYESKPGKPDKTTGQVEISFTPIKQAAGKNAGPSLPTMIRQGADGSIILTDAALKAVGAVSPRARARVAMPEAEAVEKAKARALAAQQAPLATPAAPGQAGAGVSGSSAPALPNTFDVPMRDGSMMRVQATDANDALRVAAGTSATSIIAGTPAVAVTPTPTTNDNQQPAANPQMGLPVPGLPANQPGSTPPGSPNVQTANPTGSTPSPAVSKARALVAKAKTNKSLAARLIEGQERAATRPDGIVVNPEQIIGEALDSGMTEKQALQYFNRVLDEEVRHLAQYDAAAILFKMAGGKGDFMAWMDSHYAGIWASDFAGTAKEATVRDLYLRTTDGDAAAVQADWDAMSESNKALEAIRMMSQGKNVTEQAKLWANISTELKNALRAALAALKKFADTASPEILQEIKNLENALAQLTGTPVASSPNAGNRPEKQNRSGKNAGTPQPAEAKGDSQPASGSGAQPGGLETPVPSAWVGKRVAFIRAGEMLEGEVSFEGDTPRGKLIRVKLDAEDSEGSPTRAIYLDEMVDATGERIGGFEDISPPAITGEKINDEWTAFAPESGTLGIPRAMMPQIAAGDRSALVQFLKARGVSYESDTVFAKFLKPTQTEYSPGKVKKAKEFTGGNRAILVSSDNHVLDGHHQWMAAVENDERIPVIRLDSPIRELLPMALQMPSVTVAGGKILDAPVVVNETPVDETQAPLMPTGETQTEPRDWSGETFADDAPLPLGIHTVDGVRFEWKESEHGYRSINAVDQGFFPITTTGFRSISVAFGNTAKLTINDYRKLANEGQKTVKAQFAREKKEILSALKSKKLTWISGMRQKFDPKSHDPEITRWPEKLRDEMIALTKQLLDAISNGTIIPDKDNKRFADELAKAFNAYMGTPAKPAESAYEKAMRQSDEDLKAREAWMTDVARESTIEAIARREDVPADRVDDFKLELPKGYKRRGKQYVWVGEDAIDEEQQKASLAILPTRTLSFDDALAELAPGTDLADDPLSYYDSIEHDIWNGEDPESQKKTPVFKGGKLQGTPDPQWMTPEEADAKLAEWKAQAKADGANRDNQNSGKYVVSLFDSSGVWSQPWRDAGYTVINFDLDEDSDSWKEDVMNLTREFMEDNGLDMIDIVLAQPPCTDFSLAGNRWFHDPAKAEQKKASLEKNTRLVDHTLDLIGYLRPLVWGLENPIGTIKKHTNVAEPRLVFDPFMYGADYTKRTQIFGTFNEQLPEAMVFPAQGSRIHKLSGSTKAGKTARSLTPEQFAYAFYMANRDYGRWSAERAIAQDGAPLTPKQQAARDRVIGTDAESTNDGENTDIGETDFGNNEAIITNSTGSLEESLWKPNHVVFEAISFPDYERMGYVQVPHDGTPDGMARARKQAEAESNSLLGDTSHSGSRAVATDADGKPAFYVEVNGSAEPIDSPEARYAAGNLNAFRDDALKRILAAQEEGDVETANRIANEQIEPLRKKLAEYQGYIERNTRTIESSKEAFAKGTSIKEIDARYERETEKQGQKAYLGNLETMNRYHRDNLAQITDEIGKWESLIVRDATPTSSFAADMEAQTQWFVDQAANRGYTSVDELNEQSPETFVQLAEEWRAAHPRGEGNDSGASTGDREGTQGEAVTPAKPAPSAGEIARKAVLKLKKDVAKAQRAEDWAKVVSLIDAAEDLQAWTDQWADYERYREDAQQKISPRSYVEPITKPLVAEPNASGTFQVRDGKTYGDSAALQTLQGMGGKSLPTRHLGEGDFETMTPVGPVEWMREYELKIDGFSGRTHLLRGSKEAVKTLVDAIQRNGAVFTEEKAPAVAEPAAPAAAPVDPALEAARAKARAVLDGLFAGPLPTNRNALRAAQLPKGFTQEIPADRFMPLMEAASAMVQAGVNTPEALAAEMDNLAPDRKAVPFVQAFWFALKAAGAKGKAEPKWAAIYRKIDSDAEQAQSSIDDTLDGRGSGASDSDSGSEGLVGDRNQGADPSGVPQSSKTENDSGGTGRGRSGQRSGQPAVGGSGDSVGGSFGQSDGSTQDQSNTNGATGTDSGLGASDDGNGRADAPRPDAVKRVRPEPGSPEANFVIADDFEMPASGKARIAANIKAIELLREIEQEGRNATEDEKEILSAYSGWGSFKEAFNDIKQSKWIDTKNRIEAVGENSWQADNIRRGKEYQELAAWRNNWGKLHDQISELLEPDEFRAMSKSVLNAHYTDLPIIDGMWKLLRRLGFNGGPMLENSAGGGYFIGRQPSDLADVTDWSAIELDEITSRILSKLYPEIRVNGTAPAENRQVSGQGFQDSKIPNNSILAVAGNFPFAADGPGESKSEFGQVLNLHNYFFARSLSKLQPGGIIVAITSASTMDNNLLQRELLATNTELVGAIRLPNSAFKDSAGTEVTTDIIVLRKNDGSRDTQGAKWLNTAQVGEDVVTSKPSKDHSDVHDWLSSIPAEWVPVNEALREPFKAWRSQRPRTGEKWNAMIEALKDARGRDDNGKATLQFTAPVTVNEYFIDHPEMALGRHSLQGSMYSADEYALTATEGDLIEKLNAAIETFPENIIGANIAAELANRTREAEQGDRDGSTVIRDGKVFDVVNGQLQPVQWETELLEKELDKFLKGDEDMAEFRRLSEDGDMAELRNWIDGKLANMSATERAKIETKTAAAVAKRHAAFKAWSPIRDVATKIVNSELAGATDEELATLRAELNTVYDSYVKEFGPIGKRGHTNPIRFLDDDIDSPLVESLEDEEMIGTTDTGKPIYKYVKRPIFTGRILPKIEAPSKAESIPDAIAVSMGYMGRLSVPYMAQLLGQTENEVTRGITDSGLAMINPTTGLFEISELYLSGEVRTKLQEAEKANVESGGQYQANVDALKAIMPPPRPISSISITMGARWIPNGVYTAFVNDVLKLPFAQVEYQPNANIWKIANGGTEQGKRRTSTDAANADSFETPRFTALEILDAVLNSKKLEVWDTLQGGGSVLNTAQTLIAQAKASEMQGKFIQWLRSSEKTVEVDGRPVQVGRAAEDSFNEKVSGVVPPSFTGDWVTLPGQSGEIYLLKHRLAVLARMITTGYGMMAHGVGSGKTYNLIALAMELRRLGKARKTMTIVQGSTIRQFAASHMKAYPQARILVADAKNFSARKRARFLARVATGDYDSIILTHSAVGNIGHSAQSIRNYMAKQFAELDEALKNAESGSDNMRDIQKVRDKLQERMDKMLASAAKNSDKILTWEQLGVDALLVDEAHTFKNIPIITRKDRVKNMPTSSSDRAILMQMKCAAVQRVTGGKNIFFATGTPITNTMAEAYAMLNFVAPEVLANRQIKNFDDFISTFCRTVSEPEATWKGEIENVERLAKFINGPELINIVRSVFDVALGNENLGLRVPKMKGGAPKMVMIEPTESSEIFNDWVIDTAAEFKAIPNKREAFKEDPWMQAIPIMVMQAGMAQAIDPRLINPQAPDDPNSKVNKAVADIHRIWLEGKERRTAQVVFSDLNNPFSTYLLRRFNGDPFEEFGTDGAEIEAIEEQIFNLNKVKDKSPAVTRAIKKLGKDLEKLRGKQFSVFADIKEKLVKLGVPAKEIAIAQDMSKEALEKSFDKVNSGEIRIIMGSTEKLGVGVNIQERLAAAHNISPPRDFKPAMMEQRIGRIIRQGNLFRDWADQAYLDVVEKHSGRKFDGKDLSARFKAAEKWIAENGDMAVEGSTVRELAEAAADEFSVEVLNYGLKLSMDSAVYSMMKAKQGFIEQILMGIDVMDEFDDPASAEALGYAMMAAEAMGNEDLKRRVMIMAEVQKLDAARNADFADKNRRKEAIDSSETSLRYAMRLSPESIREVGVEFEGIYDSVSRVVKTTKGQLAKEAGTEISEEEAKQPAERTVNAPVFEFGGEVYDTGDPKVKTTEPINKWIDEMYLRALQNIGENIKDTFTVNGKKFTVTARCWKKNDSLADARFEVFIPKELPGNMWIDKSFTAGLNPSISLKNAIQAITEPGSAERRASDIERVRKNRTADIARLKEAIANEKPFEREKEYWDLKTEQTAVERRIAIANANPRNHRFYRSLFRAVGAEQADQFFHLDGTTGTPKLATDVWNRLHIRLRLTRRGVAKTPAAIQNYMAERLKSDVEAAASQAGGAEMLPDDFGSVGEAEKRATYDPALFGTLMDDTKRSPLAIKLARQLEGLRKALATYDEKYPGGMSLGNEALRDRDNVVPFRARLSDKIDIIEAELQGLEKRRAKQTDREGIPFGYTSMPSGALMAGPLPAGSARQYLDALKAVFNENLGTDDGLKEVPQINSNPVQMIREIKHLVGITVKGMQASEGLRAGPLPVSQTRDAEYLAAVEAGDMETAQRMVDEAANRAGFDNFGYHGSPTGGFSTFKVSTHDETALDGIAVTNHKHIAELYTDGGERRKTTTSPRVYEVYYKPSESGRLISIEELYERFEQETGAELIDSINGEVEKFAIDNGIYAVDTQTIGERGEAFVLDPTKIKSADPVTRDSKGNVIPLSQRFNPAKDSILYAGPLPAATEYKRFPAEWNSLNVPRAEMPQVPSKERPAFLQFLKDAGVKVTDEQIAPTAITPIQIEYFPSKVERAKGIPAERRVFISADDYLLDGHHQWMAQRDRSTVNVTRIGLPVREAIGTMFLFPGTEKSEGGVFPASPVVAAENKFEAVLAKYRGELHSDTEEEVFADLREKFGDEKLKSTIEKFDARFKVLIPHKEGFDSIVKDIAKNHNSEPMLAPLKGRKRGVQKALLDYNGRVTRMGDIIRASIVANTIQEVDAIAEEIHQRFTIKKFSNRFSPPLPSGYSDMLFQVEIEPGIVAELQVHIPEMIRAKEEAGHFVYEKYRVIEDDPSKKAEAAVYEAQMLEIYQSAAELALARSTSASNASAEISGSYASFRAVFGDNGRGSPLGLNSPTGGLPGALATGMSSTSKNLVPAGKSEAVTIKNSQNAAGLQDNSDGKPQTAANIIALAKELDPVAFKAAMAGTRAYIQRRKDEGIPLGPVLEGDQVTLAAQGVLVKFADKDPRAMAMLDGYGEDQFSRLRAGPVPTPEPSPVFRYKVPVNPALVEEAKGEREGFGKNMASGKLAGFGSDRTRAEQDAIDAVYEFTRTVQKNADTMKVAREMLARDPQDIERKLLDSVTDKDFNLTPADHLAIQLMIDAKVSEAGNDATKQAEYGAMMMAYRMMRGDAGRLLQIGYDRYLTPAERNLAAITDAIFTPTKKIQKVIASKPVKERAAFIRAAAEARVAKVEAELQKAGLSIAEITRKSDKLALENSQLMKDVMKLRKTLDQNILGMIQRGGTKADIKRRYGAEAAEQAQQVLSDARADLKEKIAPMVQAGMTMEQIVAKLGKLSAGPINNAASPLSPEAIAAEIERILAEGFGMPAVLAEKPALPRAKAKPAPVPPKGATAVPVAPTAINADWSRPVFTDGLARYTFDTKDRSGIMTRVENIRMLAGAVGSINKLDAGKRAEALAHLAEIDKTLAKYGTDTNTLLAEVHAGKHIEDFRFDINDVHHVASVARIISTMDADWIDKASEVLYANMLSGLQTMVVNATAIVPAAWEATVGRGFEMAINSALAPAGLADPLSPQWGETKYILRALGPAWTRAVSNFVAGFNAQHPMFDRDVLNQQPDIERVMGGKGYRMGGSISGKKGDIIRIPSRLLMATDDFNMTLFACADVGAYAYRFVKSQGFKPGTPEFDKELRIQVNTPGSEAYILAATRYKRAIFSNPLPGEKDPVTGKTVPVHGLGDQVGEWAAKLNGALTKEHDSMFVKLVQTLMKISFFPFQRVPFNILRKGVRYTPNPVSLFDIGLGIIQNSRTTGPNGETVWEWNAQKRNTELIERLGMQLQGAALLTLLIATGAGEGDDDDLKKPFVITGSMPFTPQGRAEREAQIRSGLGPSRISFRRKDGSERFGFNYGRFEPVATTLAATIDTIKAVKRANRSGKDNYDAAAEALGGLVAQAKDKSFLRGVSDLMALVTNAMAEPDLRENRKFQQYLAGRVAMVVPNVIKQPLRETDNLYRERSNDFMQEVLYQVAPIGQKAAKVDPWGQVSEKTGTAATRIFDVSDMGTDTVHPVDKMLLKWRDSGKWSKAADEADRKPWFPSPISSATFENPRTGQTVKMNEAQLAEFREKAGKATAAKLKGLSLNYENPTITDIEKVRKAVTESRRAIKSALAFKFSRTTK